MSYIRMDKALRRKPKFRRILRGAACSEAELVGHLHQVWSVVDDLGQDFDGDDDVIAEAIGVPPSVVSAMCAEGWATRTGSVVTFTSNDPYVCSKTAKHRDRARAYYQKSKAESCAPCADSRRESAPTCAPAPPPIPTIPPHQQSSPSPPREPSADDPDGGGGGGWMGMGEIGERIDKDHAKRTVAKAVVRHCSRRIWPSLFETIDGWPAGDWIWRAYEGWRAGLDKAKAPGPYLAACIRGASEKRRTA